MLSKPISLYLWPVLVPTHEANIEEKFLLSNSLAGIDPAHGTGGEILRKS